MKSIEQVKQQIEQIPAGQPFSAQELRGFAAGDNIRQILSRLVKAGELERVARGLFARPKKLASVGAVLPSVNESVQALAQTTGETILVHGSEAARQLQLTTQVPMRPIFYTNGNTRTLKVANRTVVLKHVNPSRLVAPGTTPGLVVIALRYLGKENVSLATLEKIKSRITPKEFQETVSLVRQMPAWMADLFYRYQHEQIL